LFQHVGKYPTTCLKKILSRSLDAYKYRKFHEEKKGGKNINKSKEEKKNTTSLFIFSNHQQHHAQTQLPSNHTTFNIIHLRQPSPPNQTQQPQPETTTK
jgi:hypothetical protein